MSVKINFKSYIKIVFLLSFSILLIIFLSFTDKSGQNNLKGWDFELGTLEGRRVVSGNLLTTPTQSGRVKFDKQGRWFLGTGETQFNSVNDSLTGEISSPSFEIDFSYISIRVGGGRDENNLYVALIRAKDGTILFKLTGQNNECMIRHWWNVSHLKNEKVYIKILDQSNGFFGHLNIDDVRFYTLNDFKNEKISKEREIKNWKIETLRKGSEREIYRGEKLKNISMPIGGIGTGQVSLNGDSSFGSWEIFNRVHRFNINWDSFFAVRTELMDKKLADKSQEKYQLDRNTKSGNSQYSGDEKITNHKILQSGKPGGTSYIKGVEFINRYPIGEWHFLDESLPVSVTLEAFSPFIPTDLKNSSFPAGIFNFHIKNKVNQPVKVSLLGTIQNMVGHLGLSPMAYGKSLDFGWQINKVLKEKQSTRILMGVAEGGESDRLKQNVFVITMDIFLANLIFPISGATFVEMELHDWLPIAGKKFQREILWLKDPDAILRLNEKQRAELRDSVSSGTSLLICGKSSTFNSLKGIIPFPFSFDSASDTNLQNIKLSKEDETKGAFLMRVGISEMPLQSAVYFKNCAVQKDAQILLTHPDGAPLIIEGRYGRGKIIVCGFDLLESNTGNNARLIVGSLLAYLGGEEFICGNAISKDAPGFGSMEFSVLDPTATSIAQISNIPNLLGDFYKDGSLNLNSLENPSKRWKTYNSALCSTISLNPDEEKEITFIVTWFFPNYYWRFRWQNEWRIGNFYATKFKDASDVTTKLIDKFSFLTSATKRFSNTLYDTSLPSYLIEAVGSTIASLRSAHFFITENGDFCSWEGSGYHDGSCPLNCTHVLQYAQTIPFLFPDLAKNLRYLDYHIQMMDNGGIRYRLTLPLSEPRGSGPFLEGQADIILQTYREHLFSPDNTFLRNEWGNIKKAIKWMFQQDPDADGIIAEPQYHTFDWTLEGVNPLTFLTYLSALMATERMAHIVNDSEIEMEAKKRFEVGLKNIMEATWDGGKGYFVQKLPEGKNIDYQLGKGCLAVQLQGCFWSRLLGMGDFISRDKISRTLNSIYKNNWIDDFEEHIAEPNYLKTFNIFRSFASGKEKGLLNVVWKKGEVPEKPFPYAEEVWTGVEYLVASSMIQEGQVENALQIIRGARERYDGVWRNPFADEESGNYYTRAMSAWGLLLSAQGFAFNFPENFIGFAPKINPENFKSLFTAFKGWGTFSQTRTKNSQTNQISLFYGSIKIQKISLFVPSDWGKFSVSKIVQIGKNNSSIDIPFSLIQSPFEFVPIPNKDEKEVRILLNSSVEVFENNSLFIEIKKL